MPLRLLKQRTPLAIAVTNFLVSVAAFSTLYNVPIYFTAVKLASAENAGLHILPNAVALACGSVGAGLVMRRTGKFYYLTLFGAALPVVGNLLLASWAPSTHPIRFWVDMTLSGFGTSSFITSTLIALIAAVGREDVAVATGISYLFRTTGQVIGVSLSGALLQAVLLKNLRERIKGPDAAELIRAIRHSTTIIPSLEPPMRQAAVESYALGLRAVFIFNAVVSALCFLATLPIEENPLPGSHVEQAEHDERRRLARAQSEANSQ